MPPPWFDRLTIRLVAAVVGFGTVGMIAARLGIFVVAVVLFVGGAAAYTLSLAALPEEGDRAAGEGRRVAVAVVVLAAASVLGNGLFGSEHLLTGSEPGHINNAARELALTGELDAAVMGPFASGRVVPPPPARAVGLFPALAAAIGWFGRDAMLWTGPALSGVALLALFALGARLVRPWVALVVTAAMAVNPAFVYLARDAVPEVAVMALVLAGIAAMVDARGASDARLGAVGGALLGAAALARFDWVLLAPALALYLGLELRRAELLTGWLGRRRHGRYVAAVGAGFAVPAVLAAWLSREGGRLFAGDGPGAGWSLLAVAAFAAGLWLAWRRPGRIARPSLRPGYVAVAVVAVGLVLAVSRPLLVDVTGPRSAAVEAVQVAEGVPVEGDRSYAESSALWLAWYAGPVAAIAGLLGAALLVDGAARGRWPRWTPLLVLAGVTTAVWLLRPGLEPVHPFVMRRYLPLALPGLLLAAGWLMHRLWARERFQEWAQTAALVLAAGLVAFPAWYLADAPGAATQRGVRAGLADLCAELGDDAAVLFADAGGSATAAALAQPTQGFCELPAAVMPFPTLDDAEALARSWAAEGRALVVIGDDRSPFPGQPAPSAVRLTPLQWRSVDQTVTRRPAAEVTRTLEVWATRFGEPAP